MNTNKSDNESRLLIQNQYFLNRSPINIHDLNTSNISDGIILYEKITTNLFLSDKV